MKKFLVITVFISLITLQLLSGCAAGSTVKGEETVKNQPSYSADDTVTSEGVKTATFAMG